MSVSEVSKRASQKYNKNNMSMISLKYKKEIINYIKLQAENNKLSTNKLCINAVMYCFDNDIELKDYDSKVLNEILNNGDNGEK